ncbi:hypothetical protein GP486_003904 [Trichoglossum hirsutum]|uniref:Uncharacterized protein n=1 Tax=Trichoglossum hirsutum TaxID=265104 RepID=A0A9P8LC87_9PEZI|nr:hypothetical protein GP486_003904 [Trichoglossum hirsutum]
MDDAPNRKETEPACNTCQARKRKTNFGNAVKPFEQPMQIMDEVKVSMDGLTKAENQRVRRLPRGFGMYITSEAERLFRELPEEIWADAMVPEGSKGRVKAITAASPDAAPQPYSDPILEHNSEFNWKSLFPPECDLPESVRGASADIKREPLEPMEMQEDLQPHDVCEPKNIPGIPRQAIPAGESSHLVPSAIYQAEEFTDSWEDAYGWLRSAMSCEPFSIGHPRVNGYQPEEDTPIAEPHI